MTLFVCLFVFSTTACARWDNANDSPVLIWRDRSETNKLALKEVGVFIKLCYKDMLNAKELVKWGGVKYATDTHKEQNPIIFIISKL